MPNKDAIIGKAQAAIEKVRAGMMPDCQMFLIRRGGETGRWSVIAEVTAGFWSRWSSFREQTVFMWADAADEWMDRVSITTHVGFGVPDETGRVDVYEIANDQRDRVPPSGGNLFWKLYGTRRSNERFTIT
jgi:hypothetical protein